MGAYLDTATTLLPLLPMLPQSTSTQGYSTTVDRIGSHITRAEALINSKIASRYSPSLFTTTAVPPILKSLTEDITGYYTLRSVYASDNQNVSEWVETFKEAMETLQDIHDGKADIVGIDGEVFAQSTTIGTIESTTEDYTPTFNEDEAYNQEVDPDKFGL